MKAKSISGGLGGFVKGDRILFPHWRGLSGGMTGTVERVARWSLRVLFDNGESLTIDSQQTFKHHAPRKPREGEDW